MVFLTVSKACFFLFFFFVFSFSNKTAVRNLLSAQKENKCMKLLVNNKKNNILVKQIIFSPKCPVLIHMAKKITKNFGNY